MNLYEAIKKNLDNLDLSIEISPVQSNDVWLKFSVNYVHGVSVDGSAKVFIEGSDYGIPEYPQISKLSYNGGDECNYDRGWDVEPENKEVFNYICKSLVDYRDKHPYSLDEAEGRPSIPMDVKELVENIIYDDRNLDLRTAQFEGSNFVVEPRTNLDEALFDKIVQRISDQFNTYGISYDSIEDEGNNVVAYDCYMSDEAYKEYKDNSDDYKQEDEDFYMLNKDTDEKVHVYKDGNHWYDSDGNRYMGYLSKKDVKAYFKGNWEELNEAEDNSTKIIQDVIKSKNLPNGTKISSITDDTFNSIVKDVQAKIPGSKENDVRNKVAGTLYSMFEESDDIEIRDSSKKAYKTIYNNYSEPIRFQIRNSNGGLLGGSPTLDGAKKIASEKIAEYKDDPWNKDMKIFIERLKESDEKKVKVSLYGDVKEYPTVEDAIKDMKTAMSMCDPNSSEFKRYLDIYYQLKSGKTSCTDGFNEAEKSTVDGRAEFVRKPVNLDDIKTWGIGSDYFKVVATKELSDEEYDDFTSSLISKDYDWIKKLGKKCRCVDGCFYCIEVINKDNSSSPHILVEPEGYSYARYAAIKPTDMKEADYDSIIGKDKDRGLNESDDFYVIPGNLQSIIDSYSTDVNDPMYDNGYEVPDELLKLSLRPPENMRIRDWMRIEAPMEYQLNKIPENLTFKAIHEDPSLFKDLAYEIDSDPRDVIYNQLKDMYGEDFVSNIYEAEVKKVPKRIREYRIIDTGDNDKVLKVFSSKDSSKGYDEMRKMGEELKKQGKEDNLLYKWFYVNNPEYKEAEEVQDDTEKYWDATTLKQDAFLRVMKFNFVEPHGCQYIITNDANELERFRADSDEDAIDYYNEFKSDIDSGLIEIMPADLNIKSIVPREDFNETELSDRKFCDLPDDFQKKVINYLLKKKRGTTDEIIKYLMHAKIGDFNDTSLLTQDEFVDLYEV